MKFLFVALAFVALTSYVAADDTIITLAGAGATGSGNADGLGTNAHFRFPLDLVFDADTDAPSLFVADSKNHLIRYIDLGLPGSTATVYTLAGKLNAGGTTGEIGTTDGGAGVARFWTPSGIALGEESSDINPDTGFPSGHDLYVTDFGSHRIRRVKTKLSAGKLVLDVVETVTGGLNPVAGEGNNAPGTADGTLAHARFTYPIGIVADVSGTHGPKAVLYVSESNDVHQLRRIDLNSGTVTTLVKNAWIPGIQEYAEGTGAGIVIGELYGLDIHQVDLGGGQHRPDYLIAADHSNHVIRKFSLYVSGTTPSDHTNVVSTLLAGHPEVFGKGDGVNSANDAVGTNAYFTNPTGVKVDVATGSNVVYICDSGNHQIRQLNLDTLNVKLIAGTGHSGATDGAATSVATFQDPQWIAVDGANNLYISDDTNHNIRVRTLGGPNTGATTGDPQFAGLQGQSFQFHGLPDEYFNLITTPTFQLNSRFRYLSSGKCDYSNTQCWTHPGTYLDQLGFMIGNQQIRIVAGSHSQGLRAWYNDKELSNGSFKTLRSPLARHNATVEVTAANEVIVDNGVFRLTVVNSDYFFNIQVQFRDYALLQRGTPRQLVCNHKRGQYQKVALHGLIGNTWKNAVYCAGKFYEGEVDDYITGSLFGTDFRFNQFSLARPL